MDWIDFAHVTIVFFWMGVGIFSGVVTIFAIKMWGRW